MQQQAVAVAGMQCRNDERERILHETHVADKGFVENGVHRVAIVEAPLWVANNPVASRLWKMGLAHRVP
jgi:hypothetical protein